VGGGGGGRSFWARGPKFTRDCHDIFYILLGLVVFFEFEGISGGPCRVLIFEEFESLPVNAACALLLLFVEEVEAVAEAEAEAEAVAVAEAEAVAVAEAVADADAAQCGLTIGCMGRTTA